MPDPIDIWSVRLVDTEGKIRARWHAPRDLRERLPFEFEVAVKSAWYAAEVQFLDANERVVSTWYPPHPTCVYGGDTYVFTLRELS